MVAASQRGRRARTAVARLLTRAAVTLAGCGLALLAGCAGAAHPAARQAQRTVVWGAGNALEFPIYEEVGSRLAAAAITLNYQQLGPAAAMGYFRGGKLAFLSGEGRLSDPVSIIRVNRVATPALTVPVARVGEAVIYNLPFFRGRLRLDGATLANIFRGQVTEWNDRQIARQNHGQRLPPIPIRVVERADPNAGTAVLTSYLSAGSRRWRRAVGSGQTVHWPGGTLDSSDSSVLQTVTSTPGAIGYVEEPVALQNRLRAASLRSASGAYVAPTERATSAGSYPLISTAFVMTYHDLCQSGLTSAEATATQRFLAYLLGPGQTIVRELSFAPLSRRTRVMALREVRRLRCGSQTIA